MIVNSSNPMLALAELLIDSDYQRAELDRQNLQAAREEQRAAQAREVAALHEAADCVAAGALAEGLFKVAGAGLSAAGEASGSVLSSLSEEVGKQVGDAPRMHAEARAKQAGYEAEDARLRAEDAREHQQRVAEHSDRILDAAATVMESEHDGNLAILAIG
jgi:hypothetical protein